MTETDASLMQRAIELAIGARGHAEPNPTVGCVLVKDGRFLGEGRNAAYGGPHAEANALADAAARGNDPSNLTGATAYVTLEPCCHTNKQTPPCAPRLIEAGITRVVIGCLDPNPHVDGGGVEVLRQADIHVEVGLLESQCRQLIAPFFALTRLNRPYVTLKWAQSADGKVAGRKGHPVRITNDAATAVVHALRGRCDAVAVGTNTLINDNPLLTARTPNPPRRPIRVVLSNRLALGGEYRLFQSAGEGAVVVYTHETAAQTPEADRLRELGVEIVSLPGRDNTRDAERFAMSDVYADLASRNVTHLLIEPGPKLARELIARNQADRTWIFHGQKEIGGEGMAAPACPWPSIDALDLDRDRLVEHLNPASDAFFAHQSSPDFHLAAHAEGSPPAE